MCKQPAFKYGAIVVAKRGSLFEKILQVITEDPNTTLLKKPTRPYVVVSNEEFNYKFQKVMIAPQRTLGSANVRSKIIYIDDENMLREICYTQIMTVDICELESLSGKIVPNVVMEQISLRLKESIEGSNAAELATHIPTTVSSAAKTAISLDIEEVKEVTKSIITEPTITKKSSTAANKPHTGGKPAKLTEDRYVEFKLDLGKMSRSDIMSKYKMSSSTVSKYARLVEDVQIPQKTEVQEEEDGIEAVEVEIPAEKKSIKNISPKERGKLKTAAKFCMDIELFNLRNISFETIKRSHRVKNIKAARNISEQYKRLLSQYNVDLTIDGYRSVLALA